MYFTAANNNYDIVCNSLLWVCNLVLEGMTYEPKCSSHNATVQLFSYVSGKLVVIVSVYLHTYTLSTMRVL